MNAVQVTKQQNIRSLSQALLMTLAVVIVLAVMENVRPQANRPPVSHTASAVTLRAAPGNSIVPMLVGFAIDSRVVKQFPDGTHCINLDGPLVVNIDDNQMELSLIHI